MKFYRIIFLVFISVTLRAQTTPVDWGSIYGCEISNDTLHTNNIYLWGSAVSKNTLVGGTDGWCEYLLKDLNQYKCFGFLDSISPNALDYSDIDYGFYNHVGNRTLYGILNGSFYALGSYPVESTVLRVERVGNTINLKVNGVVMQTMVSSSDVQKNWKVKGVLYSGTNSSLINVVCSFIQKGNVSFPNYNRLNVSIIHSSGPLYANGSIKVRDLQDIPYSVTQTYMWKPGSVISSSITSKNFGTYNIMIEDNLHHKNSNIYNIGYKINWGSIYGCEISNDTLHTNNIYLWGSAVSKNTLVGGTDGWCEYLLKDLNQYKCFGFLDSISPNAQDYLDIDYGFYNHVGNRTLYGILNGSFYALGSYPIESTVLRVERVGNTINLKVNGVVMQTMVSSSDVQKNWKVKGVVYSGTNSSLINVGCSFYKSVAPTSSSFVLTPCAYKIISGLDSLVKGLGTTSCHPVITQHTTVLPYNCSMVGCDPGGSTPRTVYTYKHTGDTSSFWLFWQIYGQPAYFTLYGLCTPDTTVHFPSGSGCSINNTDIIRFKKIVNGVLVDEENIFKITEIKNPRLMTPFDPFWSLVSKENFSNEFGAEGLLVDVTVGGATHTAMLWHKYSYHYIKWKCSLKCSFSVESLVTNVSSDENNGEIHLTLSGGTPPYNIAWNGSELPSNHDYYIKLQSDYPGAVIDTLALFDDLDSLRQTPNLKNVPSGIYNNTIYDADNSATHVTCLLGNELSWVTTGVNTNTLVIPPASRDGYQVFYGTGQEIIQDGSSSTINYAVSDRAFNASEREMYTEFAIARITDVMDIGLKTFSTVNTETTTDMAENTYIHFTGNETSSPLMQIYFNNTQVYSSSYSVGDAIGILLDPVSQTISYYKNSVKVLTQEKGESLIFDKDLQIKIDLKSLGAYIKNFISIGQLSIKPNQINGLSTDASCGSSGSIQFSANSWYDQCNFTVTGPNGYSSSGSLSSTNILSGLSPGVYTVNVPLYSAPASGNPPCSGSLATTMSKSFKIDYMPDWVNVSPTLPAGDTYIDPVDHSVNLVNQQPSASSWLGGASSDNVLLATEGGWAEFKPNIGVPSTFNIADIILYTNSALSFGLNHQDLGTSPSDNDHFFQVNRFIGPYILGFGGPPAGSYLVQMYSGGALVLPVFYALPTDILRVNKVPLSGGTMMKFEFYKNNVLMGSSTTPYTAADLVADVSINQDKEFINKPRISFGCKDFLQYAVLKSEQDGEYYTTTNNNLKFTLDGEYTLGTMKFNVFNNKRIAVISNTLHANLLSASDLKPGDNRFNLNCMSLPNGYYTLEVANEKNEKLYLRFKR